MFSSNQNLSNNWQNALGYVLERAGMIEKSFVKPLKPTSPTYKNITIRATTNPTRNLSPGYVVGEEDSDICNCVVCDMRRALEELQGELEVEHAAPESTDSHTTCAVEDITSEVPDLSVLPDNILEDNNNLLAVPLWVIDYNTTTPSVIQGGWQLKDGMEFV